jgi:hypothetical protein
MFFRATTASIVASPAAVFVPVATVGFDTLELLHLSLFSASASSIDKTANPPHFTFGPSAVARLA